MRASNGRLAMALLLMVALAFSACGGDLTRSDGPIISVCGTNTGRAEFRAGDGPIYIDASLHSPTKPINAAAGSAPIHVRVSQDCSAGANVTVSNSAVIRVQDEIPAKDGGLEVADVYPVGPGRSTLTAVRHGVPSITVIFAIEPPVAPSSASLP